MDYSPPRGTQDLFPPEGDRMLALYEKASEIARLYGYRYVETPVFESKSLFVRTSGQTSEVVAKEMYELTDKGGRLLTLRPEGTAPVMRAYLQRIRTGPQHSKFFYLTRMYRYARPQRGRLREHRQFGVEIFGSENPTADVEVIEVGDAFLRDLGLSQYELQVNSLGDENCRPEYLAQLRVFLGANREKLKDEHRRTFEKNPLRVLDCKDEACRALAQNAPRLVDELCGPCRDHFREVVASLTAMKIHVEIAPTLVRGLDYYTRTAFEFVSLGLSPQQGTLFGGGRYDGLAEVLGGPHVPGVGFGMGLERVLMAIEEEGLTPPEEPGLTVFVVGVGDAGRARALELVRKLRAAGVASDTSFEDRPLKAQFRMADRAGAAYAAIIGDRERKAGTVTLRRLEDGQQEDVSADTLASRLAGGAR